MPRSGSRPIANDGRRVIDGRTRHRRGILGRASLVSLLLAAGIAALMACSQAARPAAAPADPAQGGGGEAAERAAANAAAGSAGREALDDRRG